MKDTIILTWWYVRQLVQGNTVKGCSVDWKTETLLADRILSNQGGITDQMIDASAEALVSPSAYSDEGRDSCDTSAIRTVLNGS